MSLKQKIITLLSGAVLVASLAVVAAASPASAYKCTGSTNGKQHVYQGGACYNGSTLVADDKPVKNDGSSVTSWECASGTYNSSKHTCETCTSFGSCQTSTTAKPTPKGNDTTKASSKPSENQGSDEENSGGKGECAGEKTDFFDCGGSDGEDAIVSIIKMVITIASVGVGVVAVGGIVFGAIIYASAQDSQEQIHKAVTIIRSVIIGLLLYVFMVAIINFLVPGGVFSGGSGESESQESNTQNK